MQIDVGYFYFIKDSFFDIMDDPELMKNKESGNKRPCYYCIKSKKDDNIICFIPVSTKIEKYKKKIPLEHRVRYNEKIIENILEEGE